MIRPSYVAAACVLAAGAVPGGAAASAPQPAAAAELVGFADARSSQRPVLLARAAQRRAGRAQRRSAPGVARVDAANREALREPSSSSFVNAAQIYPWTHGALYRLYAAPERVSDIALQPGERLISVAAGDTVRWVIGDTTSGAGAAQRTHILVKPSAVGLRTNLVVATDRRVYHVQLESTSRSSMVSMSWTYPQDELLTLRGAQPAAEAYALAAQAIAVENLNFGYRIKGDDPAWRPVRAFDDGRQVFIEFPMSLAQAEAPPLFMRGEGGHIELVNYRVRGRFYIVDRLFAAAELRLGKRRQQVVRILRDSPKPGRGGKGS